MIEMEGRAVHISASPGAGKTALCLGIASGIILDGGRVIWACRKMPDAGRAREILHDIGEEGFRKISILDFSSDFPGELELILSGAKDFGRRDIVIVDDWCDSYGRAKKEEIIAAERLSTLVHKTNLIITSSSYEDASGSSESGWLTRGGRSIEKVYMTVLMMKHQIKEGVRSISWEGNEKLARMTHRGLEEIVS